MRRSFALVLAFGLLAAAVSRAAAQGSLLDSANAARAAWRRVGLSQRAGLADSAWQDATRARALWPVQPAFEEGFARMAAKRGDVPALTASLERLTVLEAGADIASDSAVGALAKREGRVRDALDRLNTALAPPRRGGDLFASTPDTGFFPEGIDADARTRTIYLTSLRDRQVAVLTDGQLRPLLAANASVGSVVGVRVDTVRGVLWLTTAKLPFARPIPGGDTLRAELLRVGMADGRIERRWRLGDGTGVPGELTLAASGDVFVSDGTKARIYRLRAGGDTLETTTHAWLRSPQGIVVRDDGAVAWVADWSHGILRWDLATGEMQRVREPDGATLVGIDGLRAYKGRLIGIQNGISPSRVVDIVLDRDGRRATTIFTIDRERPYAGDITVGTLLGDTYVFVSSSQWPWFDDDGKRTDDRPLPSVVLRAVALRRR